MANYRISGKGRINYTKAVTFRFNGRDISGFEGDTIASALLAQGIHLIGRSFKYHRPRGILSAGSEEPNALLSVQHGSKPGRYEPNNRATVVEIVDGLDVKSQNHFPSLHFDIGAVNDFLLHKFIPSGFYYKTFMWPRSFWNRLYEPFIRRAAGLGVAPDKPCPDSYASRFAHTDVLVVGSGAGGLAAALEAARSGARVILVDEQAEFGGQLLSETEALINGKPTVDFVDQSVRELACLENVTLLPRTTAIGYYHQNFIGLCQRVSDHLALPPEGTPRERMWKIRAKQVILAQGAIEKPLLFHGNDRPGIMLAGAARTYLNRYGVKVGECGVVTTCHDSAWLAAFDLAGSGVKIAAILDLRDQIDEKLLAQASALGIEVLTGWYVSATKGRLRVKSLIAASIKDNNQTRNFACDYVLMSGGWTPSLHLFSHTQSALHFDEKRQMFLPGNKPKEACHCVGAGNGNFSLDEILREGALAGAAAARDVGFKARAHVHKTEIAFDTTGIFVGEIATQVGKNAKSRAFVDFQNDVTAKDIHLAVREGFKSIEHIKRYTTTGMATDQGKTSNINGLSVAANALGRAIPQVGLTTFRPPFTPTTFGSFAGYGRGRGFEVTRKTAIDSWAKAHGAVFEPVSLWRRAWYFPKTGEDIHQAVARECKAVRQSLGIFDASTLGKIEIVGPDAAEFMNRLYTNPWTKLGVGRCRYGVLLGEDGFIRDDGVVGRLSTDRFHVTTTTGGAAFVLNMMEDYLQTEWPDLRVWLTSTTEQWATIAVNGPNTRPVLQKLIEDIDLSDEAFPHMSVTQGNIAGVPTRLFRMSFTGERGYEINVPARFGRYVWERLMEAGQDYNITPYGTETMHVLRAEKGYIIVGQDTDGTLTPKDAALEWAIGKAKPDFVGKRSLTRPDMLKDDRKQLVGLLTKDPTLVLEEGAQIVLDPNQPLPMKMLGHVTSSYWSSTLNRSIALAVIEGGHKRMGETVHIPMPDRIIAANVSSTVFIDPENSRINL